MSGVFYGKIDFMRALPSANAQVAGSLGAGISLHRRSVACAPLALFVSAISFLNPIRADEGASTAAIPTLRELEQNVLANCGDAIHSAMVELLLDDSPSETERKAVIWLSGEKYRLDRTGRNKGMTGWGSTARLVLGDACFIRDEVPRVLVEISSRGPATTAQIRESYGLYDPRYLGFTPGGVSNIALSGYGFLIGRADRGEVSVAAEQLGSIKTWRLSFTTLDGSDIKYWVAPGMGYRPIQISSIARNGKQQVEFHTRAELKYYLDGKVWYPSKVESSMRVDGEVVKQNNIIVTKAQFNCEIDPKIFTVAGLGLEPGRRVVDDTNKPERLLLWNGESLVPVNPVAEYAASVKPIEPSAKWRPWLLYGNAAFLCVVASLLVLRTLRRR